MTCRATKRRINLVAINDEYRLKIIKIGDLKMSNCENCKLRAKYDNNSRSILGRIWKWHIGWCPGWKAYLKSLSDEERKKLMYQYS
jgi:hypothetical protein